MIYIIRHGQTAKNKAKLLQGRSDVSLNEEGIRESREAGEYFSLQGIRFDEVYSSPLKRAVETAELAAPGLPVHTDDRLIEMDYGPYEGMDLTKPSPEVIEFFSDFVHHPAPPGMEPLCEVTARLGRFLEEIREKAAGRNILISTHAIAMKGALEYLTPDSKGSYWSKYISNCAVYAAGIRGGEYEVPKEIYSREGTPGT